MPVLGRWSQFPELKWPSRVSRVTQAFSFFYFVLCVANGVDVSSCSLSSPNYFAVLQQS